MSRDDLTQRILECSSPADLHHQKNKPHNIEPNTKSTGSLILGERGNAPEARDKRVAVLSGLFIRSIGRLSGRAGPLGSPEPYPCRTGRRAPALKVRLGLQHTFCAPMCKGNRHAQCNRHQRKLHQLNSSLGRIEAASCSHESTHAATIVSHREPSTFSVSLLSVEYTHFLK